MLLVFVFLWEWPLSSGMVTVLWYLHVSVLLYVRPFLVKWFMGFFLNVCNDFNRCCETRSEECFIRADSEVT